MKELYNSFLKFLAKYDPDFKAVSWGESSGWYRPIDENGKDHYRFKMNSETEFRFKDMRTDETITSQLDNYQAIKTVVDNKLHIDNSCLLYTSPSPRDRQKSRMPSSA